QRRDCFHVWDEEDDAEKRGESADDTTGGPKNALAESGPGAFERNEDASDERGVNARPINCAIEDKTEHGRERDFEREPNMSRIRECIRHEQALRKRLGRARRLR